MKTMREIKYFMFIIIAALALPSCGGEDEVKTDPSIKPAPVDTPVVANLSVTFTGSMKEYDQTGVSVTAEPNGKNIPVIIEKKTDGSGILRIGGDQFISEGMSIGDPAGLVGDISMYATNPTVYTDMGSLWEVLGFARTIKRAVLTGRIENGRNPGTKIFNGAIYIYDFPEYAVSLGFESLIFGMKIDFHASEPGFNSAVISESCAAFPC